MHICILLYIYVTVLYYIPASFQKINVNINVDVPFLDPLFFFFYNLRRFVKPKSRSFLRMALQLFNRIQITST